MALKVTSQIDSRTILDMRGAEKLLGKGDMLYKGEGSNEPVRIQCPFVSEEEVKKVVEYLQKKYRHHLDDAIMIPDEEIGEGNRSFETAEEGGDDPLYEEARAIVVAAQKASTSYLQRRLSIGYSRAARIIDLLEERGVIGPARGSKPREVYEKPAEEAGDPEEDVREQF
jgi:S-DNA-T family DNA segregation ATPase FtsK/SpoIIIE